MAAPQQQQHSFAALAEAIVGEGYVEQATRAALQRSNAIKRLLEQRTLPPEGWDQLTIELFLLEATKLDSNTYAANVGVGEREGRVYSSMVARRHYHMSHGVGRSGDIAASQPKAAGSSLVACIAEYLALHAIRVSGLPVTGACIVLPLATGMAITMSLLTLRQHFDSVTAAMLATTLKPAHKAAPEHSQTDTHHHQQQHTAAPADDAAASTTTSTAASTSSSRSPSSRRFVIWPRIDQKTCLKAITTAGFEPIVIENVLEGDELRTDLAAIRQAIIDHGPENVLCVVSTTSCFAPRAPDKVVEISKLCQELGVGHIINNAYGLQASKITHLVEQACRAGRVDCFIQSTDKNFMVPVGGSIVASRHTSFIKALSQMYPGRASAAPVVDLCITLLEMGLDGYKRLLAERKELYLYMKEQLQRFAETHNERLLQTTNNPISFGLTVDSWGDRATMLGSMLFTRCCSGARVVAGHGVKEVAGIRFPGYGAHHDHYPHRYITVACAIGTTKRDIDVFLQRLAKCWSSAIK